MNRMVADAPTSLILLDCDGVVVDNTIFERRVTRSLVSSLATHLHTTETRAHSLWADDLTATRSDWRWYDYAWHAERLGLTPEHVKRAHREAGHLLAEVPGIRETIRVARELGHDVGIVTDATEWVVRFKLSQLRLDDITKIYTSDKVRAVKTMNEYWAWVAQAEAGYRQVAIIDNRVENLVHASSKIPHAALVQFQRDEHVTKLPQHVRPIRDAAWSASQIPSVSDHDELRQLIRDTFVPFERQALAT